MLGGVMVTYFLSVLGSVLVLDEGSVVSTLVSILVDETDIASLGQEYFMCDVK